MNFKIYDVVRVAAINCVPNSNSDAFNLRSPRVGDVATIVNVYSDPLGYELECSNHEGMTEWLVGVTANQFQLERVK